MARALLVGAALFAPKAARAQFRPDGWQWPEQSVGIQARLGAGLLAGEGAENVDQPPMTHASASLQVRLIPDWYLELTTFGERTLNAEAPEGKTILGLEGATAGIRWRSAVGAGNRPAMRILFGLGGGHGRVFRQGKGVPGPGASWDASSAYLLGGFEREVYGDTSSAGYAGVEVIGQQYFVEKESPFRGGGITVRATFTYYMGGDYCSECT